MQRVKHIPGVCQLHDYGITHDSITLVMARCRCSLREWRQRQPSQPHHQLRLYLNIFCRLAEIVQVWQPFVLATLPSQNTPDSHCTGAHKHVNLVGCRLGNVPSI